MDRSGDGADSADDSGPSQSYPSTLPGIPKVLSLSPKASMIIFYLLMGDIPQSYLVFSDWILLFHAGKCQAVVSTFTRANGRGYS